MDSTASSGTLLLCLGWATLVFRCVVQRTSSEYLVNMGCIPSTTAHASNVVAQYILAHNVICRCSACQLSSDVSVPFWFALKPPGGYSLQVLSWSGSELKETISSLLLRDNPVYDTLYDGQRRILGMHLRFHAFD